MKCYILFFLKTSTYPGLASLQGGFSDSHFLVVILLHSLFPPWIKVTSITNKILYRWRGFKPSHSEEVCHVEKKMDTALKFCCVKMLVRMPVSHVRLGSLASDSRFLSAGGSSYGSSSWSCHLPTRTTWIAFLVPGFSPVSAGHCRYLESQPSLNQWMRSFLLSLLFK